MQNIKKRILLVLVINMISCLFAFAVDGKTVMQKVYDVKAPHYSHSAVEMDLISTNGEIQKRMMEEWGRKEDGLVSTVIIFRSPSSVKDTRFLQVENNGRADDKWIYLPALRTVRRIAASDGSKSFMGTDATYDDMETRKVDLDNHTLIGEENVNGYDCYKVKSQAIDDSTSQYSYRISYVDKESFVPVKVEMYDKQENLLKVLTVNKLEQTNGYWIPYNNRMENVQTGHATELKILKLEIDKPIASRIFSSSFLKNGR